MFLDIILSLIIIPSLIQNNLDIGYPIESSYEILAAEENNPQRLYGDYLDIAITAENAIAVDLATNKILYQKNPDEIKPIASITKLMTALVFLDHNPGWEKIITMQATDRRNGGIVHLNTEDQLTVENLFYTALIPSDNSAAAALTRVAGFSEANFVRKMNQKAQEINLVNTNFTDPTGLDYGNTSTAQDLVVLLDKALQNENIRKTTTTGKYIYTLSGEGVQRKVTIYNTDYLLSSYLNVIGGKTGSLEKAGNCLAVKIKGEQEQEIIVVVLGSQTNTDRFQDVKAIIDFVFNNYQW